MDSILEKNRVKQEDITLQYIQFITQACKVFKKSSFVNYNTNSIACCSLNLVLGE